jgi:hypothetical protein
MKSYFCSNHDRPSKIQRPGTDFSIRPTSARTDHPGRHGWWWWRSSSMCYGAWARQSFYLRDLEEQGVSFYSLSVKQTIHGGLAAAAWSSWSSTVVHDLDWASPDSRSSSKASQRSPQASPWFNCFRRQRIKLVWQLSSCARVWGMWDEIWWVRAMICRAFGSNS